MYQVRTMGATGSGSAYSAKGDLRAAAPRINQQGAPDVAVRG